ncbi:hemin uptake protein HemP [Reyranella sp.]|uniref:hemin uptake protein HemP n=1 Tax=Reyranella sp. TaxID=1929291 RepID=UPI003D0CF6FA
MDASLRPSQVNKTNHSPAVAQEIVSLVVDSADLMNGAREIRIRHGISLYRLRVTASDKLILTK